MLDNPNNILGNPSALPPKLSNAGTQQPDISLDENQETDSTIATSIAPFYSEKTNFENNVNTHQESEEFDSIFPVQSQENSEKTFSSDILPSDYKGTSSSTHTVDDTNQEEEVFAFEKIQNSPKPQNLAPSNIDMMKLANIAPVILPEPYSLSNASASQDFPVINPAITISPTTFHMLVSETPILGVSDNLRSELLQKYSSAQTQPKTNAQQNNSLETSHLSYNPIFGHVDTIQDQLGTTTYDFSSFTPIVPTAIPVTPKSPLSPRTLFNYSQTSNRIVPLIPSIKPVDSL